MSWDFTLEDGVGDWSSVGCNYTGAEDGSLFCKCNPVTQITEMVRPDTVARKSKRVRATNFALLLVGCYFYFYFKINKVRNTFGNQAQTLHVSKLGFVTSKKLVHTTMASSSVTRRRLKGAGS